MQVFRLLVMYLVAIIGSRLLATSVLAPAPAGTAR
jgi:hypothetical protein